MVDTTSKPKLVGVLSELETKKYKVKDIIMKLSTGKATKSI